MADGAKIRPWMPSIRRKQLELIFSGAYLLRWNDKLRPTELLELDKQAHKMLIAWALWRLNLNGLEPEEQRNLGRQIIEGSIFDYFYRLIITDIKPPVFYRIKSNAEHYRQLTDYVLASLKPVLESLGPFWQRLEAWHLEKKDSASLARRILNAAHLYASRWEFGLIRPHNAFDDEMGRIESDFDAGLEEFAELTGMAQILRPGNPLSKFANLCGQLRFQIRWTMTPRIPATSVLGHLFMVAVFAYLFSLKAGACEARAINNFFGGLFHDLPELLTRDIISPVKSSTRSMPEIIRAYEHEELERRIFQPLRQGGFEHLVDEMSYYLGMGLDSEFKECRRVQGKILPVEGFADLQERWNNNENDPKDGTMLKACDMLAAYLEAHASIDNGVASKPLLEAEERLRGKICASALPGLGIKELIDEFPKAQAHVLRPV